MNTPNEPAFPRDHRHDGHNGLRKREFAAILLRVPESGDDVIDDMIRKANRRDAAVAAMQELMSDRTEHHRVTAEIAVVYARTLLDELERTA